jgi:hypothetical protein
MPSIEYRPDRPKPYRARYWGPDGRLHSRSFVRKDDAERWLTSEEASKLRSAWVDRAYGGQGLGAELLDWAGTKAADEGADWLRVDVWTTNERLQHYLREGFTYVRTVVLPHNPSGALFQRPAERIPMPHLQEVESPDRLSLGRAASSSRGGSLVLLPRPGWRDLAGRYMACPTPSRKRRQPTRHLSRPWSAT